MGRGKRVLNVFGIIFAWVLSIILVIMLIVSPIVISALSAVKPKNLAKIIAKSDISQVVSILNEDEQETVEGSELDAVGGLLSTDWTYEILELYLADFINVVGGKEAEQNLTSEKFGEIINENINEVAQSIKNADPELESMSDEDLKAMIKEQYVDNADQIIQLLPDAETLKDLLIGTDERFGYVFQILANTNTIILILVGATILISALIFVCRLFQFKGLKWLFISLFVASGILIPISAILLINSSILTGIFDTVDPTTVLLATPLLAFFTTGMAIRTAVVLLAAILLVVVYVMVKKSVEKKRVEGNLENSEIDLNEFLEAFNEEP